MFAAQGFATVVALWRLLPGLRRVPPVLPHPAPLVTTTVSVIVPTLNEATRLSPCLAGLARQREPMTEVIVVDSGSTDGTPGLVREASRLDGRIRLEVDPPLPDGWVGKVWALQHGLSGARGEWILAMDADTEPNDGLVAGVVMAALGGRYDLVSFAPRFADQSPGERWLQPAILASLIYRTGAPGAKTSSGQLLANGQCFLVRRKVLLQHGGFEPARNSFADDVRLARDYARQGVRCGFLDGRLLYRVRSYRSAAEMWREWGRSVSLADATSSARKIFDLFLLVLAQALPVPVLLAALFHPLPLAVIVLNLLLLSTRLGVLASIGPSYEKRGLPFYLSMLADPLAVLRVVLSTFRRSRTWRGRRYS
jgi:dolichol-phosphate mannosyltransferase